MAAEDPDFHRADLWNAIRDGDAPQWNLEVQVMPFEDAAGYRFNPFDLTKVWPHGDYPPIQVGRMVLDRNPRELLRRGRAGRVRAGEHGGGHRPVAGQDAARAAVQLPRHAPLPDRPELPAAADQPSAVPRAQLQQGRRDALSRTRGDPVYAPNTAGGPHADEARYGEDATWHTDGDMVRTAYTLRADDDDFGQPGTLVREVMSQEDRDHLVTNILGPRGDADVTDEMKPRIVQYWTNVDPDIGAAVANGLGVSTPAPAGIGLRSGRRPAVRCGRPSERRRGAEGAATRRARARAAARAGSCCASGAGAWPPLRC